MKIKITVNGQTMTASMEDNKAAQEFMALLPLTLELKDYNRTEKVSDLPKPLSKESSPAGVTPKVGDIAFYAPWGNLAIYYKGFDYSPGLIRLGVLDDGIEALKGDGTLNATFEIINQ